MLIKSIITTQFPPPFLMTKLWTTTQIFREMYRSKPNCYLLPVKLQRLIFTKVRFPDAAEVQEAAVLPLHFKSLLASLK